MRKKQALKVNKIRILMKNLMYLKNDFVSKEAFSRENSQMGLRQFLSSCVRKILLRGAEMLAFDIFSRYADCQLGGVLRKCQHRVIKWAFLASADMRMTQKQKSSEIVIKKIKDIYSKACIPT